MSGGPWCTLCSPNTSFIPLQAFVSQLGHFIHSTHVKVEELKNKCRRLEENAKDLYEYFGEESA